MKQIIIMSQLDKETVERLENSVDNLTYAVEQLAEALNRTDDFNRWTLAESMASIANSFYKYTAILNKQNNNN